MSAAYSAGQYIAQESLPFAPALAHIAQTQGLFETLGAVVGYTAAVTSPFIQPLIYAYGGYQAYKAISDFF